MSIRNLLASLAWCVLPLMQLAALAETTAPPPATAASAPAAPPPISITCVLVRDRPLWERLTGILSSDSPAKLVSGADQVTNAVQPPAPCNEQQKGTSTRLVGIGDIELAIARSDYDAIARHEQVSSNTMLLYVNGVALPKDGRLAAVEHFGTETHLRYRINQGEDTQELWASIYRDKGLLGTDRLRPALGWTTSGPGNSYVAPPPPPVNTKLEIGITSLGQVRFAVGVIIVLLVALIYVARTTDALRDAPLPTWYADAENIRKDLGTQGADEATVLKAVDAAYDANQRQYYIDTAQAALAGGSVPDGRPKLVAIGLALADSPVRPARASYSLARVQMAVWFAFAIAGGLFLWIIYGQLRRIDGSLLALLMISVGTSGISLGVDRNAGGRSYTRSRGLFLDLVTGFDNSQQVHRYQAVVVNLLLLFVGISHVLQQLTYPIFDATWLALLGVSGAALGLGKQVLEQPAEPPAPAAPRAAAGAATQPATDGSVG